MKKFIVTILAFLYIFASAGATVHLHFCMGKLVNLELANGKSKKCNKCSSKKKASPCSKKCCQDQHKTFKLEQAQKTVETGLQLMQFAGTATPVSHIGVSDIKMESLFHEYPVTNSPPRTCKVDFYIQHCSFLI